jgi:hypothetical protein
VHSPGNTRHDGLRRIFEDENDNTQYIFFADNDDEFMPDCLPQIKQIIKENNFPNFLYSDIGEYVEE